MRTYEIGVLALGMAGMEHVKAFTKNPRTRVKAACTRDLDKLAAVCAEYDIPRPCSSFDALLAAGIDVLVVATPDHLHTEYALAGLETGLHILCEKPLVTELEDARRLVSAAKKAGTVFMTGQCARFFPRSQFAHGLVERQELGKLFFGEADYLHNLSDFLRGWRIDPSAPQSIVLGGGCHPLDLLRWLMGDVEEVHAVANKLVFPESNPIEHDCALMSLKFVSGAVGKCLVSVGCCRPYSLGLSLYGDAGTLSNEELFLGRYEGLESFMQVPLAPHLHGDNGLFDEQAQHLVECLDEGRQPTADVVEGAKTVATCLAGAQSIVTGKPVEVCNEF